MSWLQKGNGESEENGKTPAKYFAFIPDAAQAQVDFDLQMTPVEICSSVSVHSFIRL